jgi:hypothetical protein
LGCKSGPAQQFRHISHRARWNNFQPELTDVTS